VTPICDTLVLLIVMINRPRDGGRHSRGNANRNQGTEHGTAGSLSAASPRAPP
jgi:hypothetical protein